MLNLTFEYGLITAIKKPTYKKYYKKYYDCYRSCCYKLTIT